MASLLPLLSGMSSEAAFNSIRSHEDIEDLKSFMDLRIPDNMLKSFFTRFPLSLINSKPKSYFDKKRYVKVQYQSSAVYQASIDNHYEILADNTDHCQLTIKLSHDGFIYSSRKFIRSKATTHKRTNWFVLSDDIFVEMPFLKSLANQTSSKVDFYYNIKHKRIDIHFFKPEMLEAPHMMITFETGHPCYVPKEDLMF